MRSLSIIKEYLVGLGISDNFSGKLSQTLNKASGQIKQFAKNFSKSSAVATGFLIAANAGISKFATNLVKGDEELAKFAKSIGKSKEEAFKLKFTLDAMGKTMEEIEQSDELSKTFQWLQKDAEKIKPPDLSEGLAQVKGIQEEFTRLKQSGMYAMQWIGHYLFKYLQQPMQKIKENFGGLNDIIIKNMPKWSEKIGLAMSSIVRLGITLIRGAMLMFNAIKRIFDMIPKEIKMVTTALAGLALFIRAGPIGKLIAIFAVLLLLLEDFFVYLDGGESQLGKFWQTLIDIWTLFKDSGALDKLKENFKNAMNFCKNKILEVKGYIVELFDKFKESGSIEKFKSLIISVKDLFLELLKPIKNIGRTLLDSLGGNGKDFLEWFVEIGIPKAIDVLKTIVDSVKNFIAKLNEMGAMEPIIMSLVTAFLAFKTIRTVGSVIDSVTTTLGGATETIRDLSERAGSLRDLFRRLADTTRTFTRGIGSSFRGMASSVRSGARMASSAVRGSIAIFLNWTRNSRIVAIAAKALGVVFKFLTGPIGLIVMAIAALIGIGFLVIKNWDKVKEFFIGFGAKVKEVVGNIVNHFKEMLQKIKDRLTESNSFFAKIFLAIFGIIETTIANIIERFKLLFTNIKLIIGAVKDVFSGDFSSAYKKIMQVWNNIKAYFISVVANIKQAFAPIADWFGEKVESIIGWFAGLPNRIGKKFSEAVNNIELIFATMFDYFKGVTSGVVEAFRNLPKNISELFSKAIEKIKNIFSPIINFFSEKWNSIKEIFSQSDSFFGQAFTAAMRAIESAFVNVIDFFEMIWENIKLIFSVVKSVLSGDFQSAYEAVAQIWNNIISFFAQLIKGIKNVFQPLVNWFQSKATDIISKFANIPYRLSDKFLEAVNKIKNVFSPLVDWFDDKVGKIKGFFGGIGDTVNNAKSWVNEKASAISGKLKGYANGGIVTQHHIAEVAEGNKPEAIIPLTKPARAKELLASTAEFLGLNNADNNLTQKVDALVHIVRKSTNMLNQLHSGLNKGSNYLNTTNNNSVVNNYKIEMPSNYTIHDSSGRPQSIASAVDRTTQMRIRNLQGVLG